MEPICRAGSSHGETGKSQARNLSNKPVTIPKMFAVIAQSPKMQRSIHGRASVHLESVADVALHGQATLAPTGTG